MQKTIVRLMYRYGPRAVLALVVAMFLVAASSAILAWTYRDQFHELKAAIYHRCQQRSTYDETQQSVNRAILGYYDDLLGNIAANGAHDAFYRRLTARVQVIRRELHHNLGHGAPVGCAQYK